MIILYVGFSRDLRVKEYFASSEAFIHEQGSDDDFEDSFAFANDSGPVLAMYDNSPWRKHLLPGENGEGVVIPFFRMREEQTGYQQHAFNSLASDLIPLDRRLKDYRQAKYGLNLSNFYSFFFHSYFAN